MSLVLAVPASQYMIAPSLQQGFIDKDSGELLVFGYVNFFRDADHSARKPVYSVGGPPDAPVFTELPNPLFLSSIGTFVDPNNNQDIIPWYLPFDEDGNVDLYYIEVYNSGDVLQFTRDHYPSVEEGSGPNVSEIDNLIQNGQFLLHLDQPTGPLDAATDVFNIGYGGWNFKQTVDSSSVNFVTFIRYNAPTNSPEQNPRYAVEVKCTTANPTDTAKHIYNVIDDVNFLQGQDVTLQVTAYSNDGNEHDVRLIVGKFFGVGGSAPENDLISTFTVTPEIQNFNIPFTISSNTGKTLGTGDDDYVAFLLQSPLASVSTILFTDVMLVAGTFPLLTYPPTPPSKDKMFSLAGSFSIPAYDGSDVGKFVQVGLDTSTNSLGFSYQSAIPTGTVLSYGNPGVPPYFLACDGASYAIDPHDGRGSVTAYLNLFLVIGNNYGTGLNGFFNTATMTTARSSITWNRYDVLQPAPIPATSGLTFTLDFPVVPNVSPQVYLVDAIPGSSIVNGSYFILPVNTTGPQFIQLFYFSVDSLGTIPNVPYDVARRIDITSSMTAAQVSATLIYEGNGLFQVPDLRGNFIRYWNANAPVDNPLFHDSGAPARSRSGGATQNPDVSIAPSGSNGNNVGSYQTWQLGTSPGSTGIVESNVGGSSGLTSTNVTVPCEVTVYLHDNHPNNLYFNAIIKY